MSKITAAFVIEDDFQKVKIKIPGGEADQLGAHLDLVYEVGPANEAVSQVLDALHTSRGSGAVAERPGGAITVAMLRSDGCQLLSELTLGPSPNEQASTLQERLIEALEMPRPRITEASGKITLVLDEHDTGPLFGELAYLNEHAEAPTPEISELIGSLAGTWIYDPFQPREDVVTLPRERAQALVTELTENASVYAPATGRIRDLLYLTLNAPPAIGRSGRAARGFPNPMGARLTAPTATSAPTGPPPAAPKSPEIG